MLTQADIKEMEYKTNLKGILDECRKILERQERDSGEREKILIDIQGQSSRDHRLLGEIKDHQETLASLYTSTTFCKNDK